VTRVVPSKSPVPSDPLGLAMIRIDGKRIFFSDSLRYRWERIVLGERA
jgi:hypothetical protein